MSFNKTGPWFTHTHIDTHTHASNTLRTSACKRQFSVHFYKRKIVQAPKGIEQAAGGKYRLLV